MKYASYLRQWKSVLWHSKGGENQYLNAFWRFNVIRLSFVDMFCHFPKKCQNQFWAISKYINKNTLKFMVIFFFMIYGLLNDFCHLILLYFLCLFVNLCCSLGSVAWGLGPLINCDYKNSPRGRGEEGVALAYRITIVGVIWQFPFCSKPEHDVFNFFYRSKDWGFWVMKKDLGRWWILLEDGKILALTSRDYRKLEYRARLG